MNKLKTKFGLARKFPDIQDISLEQIYDYMERGFESKTLPEEVMHYLDAMDKVRAMRLRFDKWGSKEAIVSYLMKVEGYSRYLATKLHNQAVEFFYVDPTASKQALLNELLEKMEKNLNVSILLVKNTADAAKVQKMMVEMKDMIKEIYPDSDALDEEFTRKPIKLYTQNPEDVGLPPVNRSELKKMIEGYPELHEVVLEKIRQEAGELPMKLFLDEKEDPREQ